MLWFNIAVQFVGVVLVLCMDKSVAQSPAAEGQAAAGLMGMLPINMTKLPALLEQCSLMKLLELMPVIEPILQCEGIANCPLVGLLEEKEVIATLCENEQCPVALIDALDPERLPSRYKHPEVLAAAKIAAPIMCARASGRWCVSEYLQEMQQRLNGRGCCSTISISGAEPVQPLFMGTYTRLARSTSSASPKSERAVYRNRNGKYLYFWPEWRDWVAGSDYKVGNAEVSSSDKLSTLCPDAAFGWHTDVGGEWSCEYAVSVQCQTPEKLCQLGCHKALGMPGIVAPVLPLIRAMENDETLSERDIAASCWSGLRPEHACPSKQSSRQNRSSKRMKVGGVIAVVVGVLVCVAVAGGIGWFAMRQRRNAAFGARGEMAERSQAPQATASTASAGQSTPIGFGDGFVGTASTSPKDVELHFDHVATTTSAASC